MKADVRMVELMHAISIYEAWASEPWRLTSGQLNFVCMTCLMKESVWTGTHIIWTVAAVFSYLCFGKKSFNLSNTERHLAVLLRCPDGCKLEQFKGSRHRGRSKRKVLVGRTNDAWKVERNITSSGRMQGIQFLWLGIWAEFSRNKALKWRLWK
jgi:hypothetical protein